MNWKYCLVKKKILNADNQLVDVYALHFMFADAEESFVSEEAAKAEALSQEELVKYLFDMIRTLQSPDLEIVDEGDLDVV